MAEPILKSGTAGGIQTGTTTEVADRALKTVTVEGTYADLEDAELDQFVPDDHGLVRAHLAPTGGGMGRLTLYCIEYEEATVETAKPVRETVEIDMEEVTYDLVDHPSLADVRSVCEMWLATDAAKRRDGDKYQYTAADGGLRQITEEAALKFCAAYCAGIRNFVRYYPVIELHSIYKNPPGIVRSGCNFAQGSPKFSTKCGTYDSPPVSLNGYPDGNWHRGGDRWLERGNRTWELVAKWTYTPEGPNGDHGWIYNDLSQGEDDD